MIKKALTYGLVSCFGFRVFNRHSDVGKVDRATPTPAPQPSSASSVVGAPAGTVTVFIPKGTIIVVATLEGLSSYAAHTGEKLQYVATQDVVVDGCKIAEAGDSAEGQVLESQAGEAENGFGFGFKGGDLRVTVDVVYNFCGDSIAMTFDRTEYRRRQGMFGSNKDVQIIKGQKYGALVSRPQNWRRADDRVAGSDPFGYHSKCDSDPGSKSVATLIPRC